MSETTPGNGWLWRIGEIERRVEKIEKLEPAVMRQELRDVKDDIKDIAKDVMWVKRTFIGFCVTFAFSSVTLVVMITTSRGGHF